MATNAVGRFDDITPKVVIRRGSPNVYRLIPKRVDIGTIRRLTFGEKKKQEGNKTILLVGETGSGKTTLINALVNYILGVKLEDNIWFDILQEEEAKRQSESQTSDISVYELFGFKGITMPFSLTIIDTPGFGDTKGNEYDEIISKRLSDLFSPDDGVHELNAVGLVRKSSDNRLPEQQKYIIDSVLSLFGKDMEKSIVTLITHSGGEKPNNVLTALEDAKIKCAKDEKNQLVYFLFNNCQKENREEENPDILKHLDTITRKGMEQFTKFLEKTEPQLLLSTRKVLDETSRLKACIENLKERVEFTEKKQTEIKGIKDDLEKLKEIVTFEEAEKVKEHYEGGRRWTSLWLHDIGTVSCIECEENCHDPCYVAWTKGLCEIIQDDNCTVCTGKCSVSYHIKEQWRYVTKTKKVTMTKEEWIKKHFGSNEGVQLRDIVKNLEDDLKKHQKEKDQQLEEAYQHVLKLEKIALSFKSVVTHDHLDFLIDKMKERGFEDKARKLEEIKTRHKKNYKM